MGTHFPDFSISCEMRIDNQRDKISCPQQSSSVIVLY